MLEIKSLRQGKVGSSKIDDSAFQGRMNPVVLREAVLMYEANRRVGTASTLTRSNVKGSTKKIYRQKGTGRARHGDRKAPIFRGGGVAHGPHPRDYSYAMPRKALKRALKVALAGKLKDEEVLRWEGAVLEGDRPSTKSVRASLETLGVLENALLVAPETADRNLVLSVRNLRRIRVMPAQEVSAYDLVYHRYVVLLDGAWEALCRRLGEGAAPDAEEAAAGEGNAS